MLGLTFILFFVMYLLYVVVTHFNSDKSDTTIKFTHGSTLEIVSTLIPALVLILIAIPSFSLLYSLDEIKNPSFTIKIIGHQ